LTFDSFNLQTLSIEEDYFVHDEKKKSPVGQIARSSVLPSVVVCSPSRNNLPRIIGNADWLPFLSIRG